MKGEQVANGANDQVSKTGGQTGFALWTTLAQAGPKATAEALSTEELERLHVPTALDDFVIERVKAGYSIVLTGNAGDGKTHVLCRIRSLLEQQGAVVLEDATASMRHGDAMPVINAWRAAVSEDRPFCLAANEFPLYELRKKGSGFAPIDEVSRQCDHWLAYGAPQPEEEPRDRVLVIDLSLRNPLAPGFSDILLDKLLNDPAILSAAENGSAPVLTRNRQRLADKRVRERLRLLLDRAILLGHRTTVRELWILASRMLIGTRGLTDVQLSDWYSQLLFARDERFELTRALNDVDPAECSHPQLDLGLETRVAALRTGWFWGEPSLPPHPDLNAELFSALKRAFFFEHKNGTEALALSDPDAQQFRRLLENAEDSESVASGLISAINAAYCPVGFSGREHHLYLWIGHRFHEQPSRSFLASDRIATDDFSVEVPRLPSRLKGAFDYRPDHVVLTAKSLPGTPRLKIEFGLFRTLQRLGRGLPRKLVPERDIHRIDAFLEKLGTARTNKRSTLWSVHLENLEVLQIDLSADRRRYERVRAL